MKLTLCYSDQTHIGDGEDGHVYMLHTWYDERTLYFKYTIKPINNGNITEVNLI